MELKELVAQKPVWLAASCFCLKDKWNSIFTEMRNIIEGLNHSVFSYHIQINNRYGDNVTVFLLTNQEKIDDVGKKIRLGFEPLLSSFSEEKFKLPINSILLPFPTNTLEFGLHVIYFNEKILSEYKILKTISDAIIVGLKEEKIMNDTIVAFSFYLQISLIKACSQFLSKSEDWISVFYIQENLKSSALIEKALEENLDLVLEIISDIMENEKLETEWLTKWYNACYAMIQEKIICIKNDDNIASEKIVKEFYLTMTTFIFHQIGLSQMREDFTKKLLNYSLRISYGSTQIMLL